MGLQQHILAPGEGTPTALMPGEHFTWKATGAGTAGALDVAELVLAPQVETPEHIHHRHDEVYYILEGTFRFKIGDVLAEGTAGSFIFIPRGTPHAWKNSGTGRGRALLVFTPGGMDGYFTELQPFLPALMPGIADLSQVDPAVLTEAERLMQRYGYELVGPPLA